MTNDALFLNVAPGPPPRFHALLRTRPMPIYKAPVADTMFLLTDVFGLHRYENLPRFADAQIDVVEAVLSEGGKLAEEVLQPLNLTGDQEGCRRLPDGIVRVKSILPARASRRTGTPLFLLTN